MVRLTHRQVEFFKAVMEQGTITGAASSLGISQPAVSKALSALEAEIGFPLFERTQNGVVPTIEARAFYTEVDRSFSGLAYLSDVARNLVELKHGRLMVGVIPALSFRWLPFIVARFIERFPKANLTFEAVSSPHMAQLIGQGRIDLGLCQTSITDPSVHKTPMFDINVGVVMHPSNRLAAKSTINSGDLADEPMIGLGRGDIISLQLKALTAEQVKIPNQRVEVSLGSTLCHLVAEGVGIGLVDEETYTCCKSADLAWRPFEPRISMPISLLQSQRQPPSHLQQQFVQHLRNCPAPPHDRRIDP